ncbi:MBL fold metallo-hydrolase [Aureimonas sp. AU40]|uniref:MBL fold metallo-hydrolase n=1 Tax=Aureimonas sp. AU40 TaxID=1637747 RepID=UPI0007823EE0|nr:MBL fold metallo-hydrolase [Aureimonas sp. AU40]
MSDTICINRRHAMMLAAGGLAATGLGLAPANAQSTETSMTSADTQPLAPGWHRFRIGEAEITVVLDGIRPGEGPHPTFGEDQSADAVGDLMAANHLPRARFVNFFNVVVVKLGDQRILVDTGFGEGGRANGMGLLRERLAAAGLSPDDITLVALTHLHGDHIGGLTEGGAPAFPKASYVVGRAEMAFWTSDEAKNGPRAENAKAVEKQFAGIKDKVRLIEDGEAIVPGMVARAAFGHTPGMLAFEVTSGGKGLMLTADIFSQFVVSFQKPDWQVRFDQDKPAAAETRKRFARQLAESGMPLLGYHLPFPGLGYVATEGESFRFVPETYQTLAEG